MNHNGFSQFSLIRNALRSNEILKALSISPAQKLSRIMGINGFAALILIQ